MLGQLLGKSQSNLVGKPKKWRYVLLSLVVAIAVSGLHGCNWLATRSIAVESLLNPTLPTWIKEISPLNEASPLN